MLPMKIASIPQFYRNANRWREILAILSKYGLAGWINRLDLAFAKQFLKDADGQLLARHSTEARYRMALVELGPTFIKLGQILSTRPDLIGVPLAAELSVLQDQLQADPPDKIVAAIECELGQPLGELFADFELRPVASASIAQVHRARLKTGQQVAVKVQHVNIEQVIRVDLEILAGLAQMAARMPEFEQYRPQAVVAEFQRTLRRELDFTRELRHMEEFARNFCGNPTVRIPRAFPEYCSGRVLTMEFLDGVKLTETTRLSLSKLDLEEIAVRGSNIYLEMIFAHGFYHADPHPGNWLLLPGNVIGLLDYGMVGRIDERLHEDIEEMAMALGDNDATLLTSIITRIGHVPPQLDHAALCSDLSDYINHYANQSFDDFDLSGALNEAVEMGRRYRIVLPARVAMLIKTLVMLEGTGRGLVRRFSLMDLLAPYQKRMVWRRLSPKRYARKARRFYSEMERFVSELPGGLVDILHQVQSGKFDVHLDHRGLEPSVNRLVLGMLASAMFLGSSLLLAQRVPPMIPLPLLEHLSLLGLAGVALSLGLGLRLLRAINKSGHLEQRRRPRPPGE